MWFLRLHMCQNQGKRSFCQPPPQGGGEWWCVDLLSGPTGARAQARVALSALESV